MNHSTATKMELLMHPSIKSVFKLTPFRPPSSEHNLMITVVSFPLLGRHELETLKSVLDQVKVRWRSKSWETFMNGVCAPSRYHLPPPGVASLQVSFAFPLRKQTSLRRYIWSSKNVLDALLVSHWICSIPRDNFKAFALSSLSIQSLA
jgi:hypothetical protein